MPQISSPTPDATSITKGKIQLAGDLAGTAAAPVIGTAKVTPTKLATGAAASLVATAESTTSTSYVDLTTTTDTVTVAIGANGLAIVNLYSWLQVNLSGSQAWMGFAVSGATTQSPNDNFALEYTASAASASNAFGASLLVTGLAAGSTTFKLKYRVNSGTGTFTNRRISVIPI